MNFVASNALLKASQRKSAIRGLCFQNGAYLEAYFYIFFPRFPKMATKISMRVML